MQIPAINTENLSVYNTLGGGGVLERMIACCLGRGSYLWRIAMISGAYLNHTLIPARLANRYAQNCLACKAKAISSFIGLRKQICFKTYCCPCASNEGLSRQYWSGVFGCQPRPPNPRRKRLRYPKRRSQLNLRGSLEYKGHRKVPKCLPTTEPRFLGLPADSLAISITPSPSINKYYFFFFFYCRYNPVWVLAISVIFFHSALFSHCFLRRLTPIICKSSPNACNPSLPWSSSSSRIYRFLL
jgi:hypothetical protein